MAVKHELVDRPMRSKKFELKALRIREYINNGIVTMVDQKGVSDRAKEITRLANALFKYGKHSVRIVHEGEAQSLALLEKIGSGSLLIDERTTRLLIEDLDSLKKYIQHRTGFHLKVNKQVARDLKGRLSGIPVMRSSEVLAYAFENGNLDRLGGAETLHASLYGLKFAGCAITSDEIEQYVRLLS
jgi:hypothetical protein